MDIFISWSGTRSKVIAQILKENLPNIIQYTEPWMSDQDISAGARWLPELSQKLERANYGIICITPENQHNPWLLFESGSLAKALEQSRVCPILFDMTSSDLAGPLTQFQSILFNETGIKKLINSINESYVGNKFASSRIDSLVNAWWPTIEKHIANVPPVPTPIAARDPNDQLNEILTITREQLRRENIKLDMMREKDSKIERLLSFMEISFSFLKDQRTNSLPTSQTVMASMHQIANEMHSADQEHRNKILSPSLQNENSTLSSQVSN